MNGWKPWTTQYILRQQARRSEYGKTESGTGMGQGVPEKRQSGTQKSDLSQPLRHHAGGGYVHAEGHRGQAARHCRQRSVRCGKGAVLRSVCAENGRAWLLDDCLRSVLHRRERRYTPLCRFAGHQHRGFLRCGRLSLRAGECGLRAYRYHRYLRLGRHGNQCRSH